MLPLRFRARLLEPPRPQPASLLDADDVHQDLSHARRHLLLADCAAKVAVLEDAVQKEQVVSTGVLELVVFGAEAEPLLVVDFGEVGGCVGAPEGCAEMAVDAVEVGRCGEEVVTSLEMLWFVVCVVGSVVVVLVEVCGR